MGISAGWIAVSGLRREEVAERLGLAETSEQFSIAERWFERDEFGIGELTDGRLLVVTDELFERPDRLEGLSQGASIVVGNLEEHVDYHDVFAMTDGKMLWRVICREGGAPVETEGTLPKSVAAKLKPDDFEEYGSEAIMEIAQAEAGFRADEDGKMFDNTVELFRRPKKEKAAKVKPAAGGFFAKLFGKG